MTRLVRADYLSTIGTLLATLFLLALGLTLANAEVVTGTPGSPTATTTLDGKQCLTSAPYGEI